MPDDDSALHWIHRLQQGDSVAVRKLWEGYYHRLVGLARQKLGGAKRRAADEEDAALSALASFCRGAAQGRFPDLADPDDLWRLLVVITARKAADQRAREGRQKRGGGKVHGDSVFHKSVGESDGGWEGVIGTAPTPEFAAQTAEELERLLGLLPDDEARSIAQLKMEGYTNDEIAAQLGCSRPTVERRLRRVIRRTWQTELGLETAADGSSPS